MVLPPSWFVKASAIWGEYLNYRGEGSGIGRQRDPFLTQLTPTPAPLGSLDTLPRSRSPLYLWQQFHRRVPASKIPRKNRETVKSIKFSGFLQLADCCFSCTGCPVVRPLVLSLTSSFTFLVCSVNTLFP